MSARKPVILGEKFNMLIVIAAAPIRSGATMVRCKCDCGKETVTQYSRLRQGGVASCGCLRLKKLLEKCITHRKGGTREHKTWDGMIQRCTNPKNPNFHYYGGRGIKVCERWRNFENFFSDMGLRPEGHTIDRIDPNGDYNLENCRWANSTQQAINKRKMVFYEINGEKHCVNHWSRITGIHRDTIRSRLLAGWPPEKAILKPVTPFDKRNRTKHGNFTT